MSSIWPIGRNISTKGRVFVGLSGGVDSAVSAALLKQQGYDVTGVFIRIAIDGYPCTAGVDKLDAMRVAAHLKIPFLSVDLSEQYKRKVFDTSIKEFEKGRTPNPDTLCNKEIKFGLFFDWCMEQGADLVATGHYAQTSVVKSSEKSLGGGGQKEHFGDKDFFQKSFTQLLAGMDENKDQSYFLWAVSETKLRKTLFPIGHLTKPEVRTLAQKFGLPNAERKDSQGLCFLGPVSMNDMLHREIALVPGMVLDEAGAVVGEHEGVQAYTLGQRHGFTLTAHTPETAVHFVIAKNISANTITVSTERFPKLVSKTRVTLADINWIGEVPNGTYTARYRYRQKLIAAEMKGDNVVLLEPHYIPLGQSLVLYEGKRCLGGGIVDTASLE